MAKRSNNSYYQSSDLGDITNNLSKIMGMSGNADSNYLTNLGKVSRYEGTELDNRKKENQAALILEALASTTDPVKRAGLGHMTSFTDSGTGESAWQRIPGLVAKGKSEAAGAESKAKVEGLLAGLAEQITKHGKPDIADYDTSNPNGMRPYEDAIKGSAANFENLIRKYGAIKGGSSRGQHKTAEHAERKLASEINKDISVIGWNNARRDGYKNVSAANVTKIEQETTNLLDKNKLMGKLNSARIMEIKNRVLNNIAELDQKILTSKLGREKLDAQIAVEIEKELTQAEKTETQWFKTATAEETLKTQEQKTAKAKNLADMSAQELEKLPQKLTDEASKRTKQLEKIDKDIAKLEQQTSTSATQEKLANARRMRVNVQKRMDRILGDARKILIDTQAGNWGTRTYNMLKYPNKNIKKGSTTGTTTGTTTPADSTGRMLTNDGAFADLESETPNIVMPGLQGVESILKALGIGGGGSTAPVTRSATAPAAQSSSANKILSGLEGQGTSGWNANQIKAFVKKVVAESGGTVTPQKALEILKISQQGN